MEFFIALTADKFGVKIFGGINIPFTSFKEVLENI